MIAAESGGTITLPSGEEGAYLRAYDKQTGADAGQVVVPAAASGSPMTYMHDGQQYIVFAISGGGFAGELIAYRWPEGEDSFLEVTSSNYLACRRAVASSTNSPRSVEVSKCETEAAIEVLNPRSCLVDKDHGAWMS